VPTERTRTCSGPSNVTRNGSSTTESLGPGLHLFAGWRAASRAGCDDNDVTTDAQGRWSSVPRPRRHHLQMGVAALPVWIVPIGALSDKESPPW